MSRRLAVDHDHVTGEVRGLLCLQCNRLLGIHERLVRQCGKRKSNAYLEEDICPES